MRIGVTSEIGKLKKVLLHRPGGEIEHLTPNYLSRLLFDDIPFLDRAQIEHDAFSKVLKDNGTEVVYLSELTAQAICTDAKVRRAFIEDFLTEAGTGALRRRKELFRFLMNIEDPHELVLQTMEGIAESELSKSNRGPLTRLVNDTDGFVVEPIPNLYFTRDPMAVIGHSLSLNYMASRTRNRETLYGRYIFRYHPDFCTNTKRCYTTDLPYNIEGGDICVLNPSTIAVGFSERTSAEAIELLAKNLFSDEESAVENIIVVDIPSLRAFMHLDTVFTQADKDVFLVHPGVLGNMRFFRVYRGAKGKVLAQPVKGSLESVLSRYLELDNVTIIKCGGSNTIASSREQWNDGSNVLCLEPGTVVVYDRNTVTNQILEDNGIKTIPIQSSELSRGRGGPHCMSMPLLRD